MAALAITVTELPAVYVPPPLVLPPLLGLDDVLIVQRGGVTVTVAVEVVEPLGPVQLIG